MKAMPDIYKLAEWRNTTPVDKSDGTIGVGFNLSDGSIIRLCLPVMHAKMLHESIHEFLNDHSEISSGIPSVAVSTPLEIKNV